MKKVLYNANVILFDRVLHDGGIEITDGKISAIFNGRDFDASYEIIDCCGMYVSPGFIDLHLHGGGGSDVLDGTEQAVETVIAAHAKHGTTALLPTTLSNSEEKVISALKAIEHVQRNRTSGPKILGAHLEGNFFSIAQKGAQDQKFIYPPTRDKYEPLISSVSNIKMISCAPELFNALAFAKEMTQKGIVMSVGHSDATYDEFSKAVENGFTHITHIYNGNSYLHSPYYYCQIGACEAALLFDSVVAEVIADGKHLPPQLLKLIYKIKGADHVNLCTDAMCAADMPEGVYKLGELSVVVEDGVAALPDRSSFAGSVCTSDRAVRTMFKQADVPIVDAVKMMSATPARLMGVFDAMGSITVGKAADINVFDEDVQVKYTLIDGVEYNNYF